MITFFRKIRFRLLAQNKFTRFLFYAFGEIMLVVVGILLALLINNLNEQKKLEREFKSGLVQVNDDLEGMIREADALMSFFMRKDSIIHQVMENKLTEKDYLESPNLSLIIANIQALNLRDDGYKNLAYEFKELPDDAGAILKELKQIYDGTTVQLEEIGTLYLERVNIYLKWINDTKPWSSDFYFNSFKMNQEKIDFYLNDPYYKNYVTAYYNILILNYLPLVKALRMQAFQAKLLIDQYLGIDVPYNTDLEGREAILGVYANKTDTIRVTTEQERLYAQYMSFDKIPIIHIGKASFITMGTYFCSFIYNDQKEITGLTEKQGDFEMHYKKIE